MFKQYKKSMVFLLLTISLNYTYANTILKLLKSKEEITDFPTFKQEFEFFSNNFFANKRQIKLLPQTEIHVSNGIIAPLKKGFYIKPRKNLAQNLVQLINSKQALELKLSALLFIKSDANLWKLVTKQLGEDSSILNLFLAATLPPKKNLNFSFDQYTTWHETNPQINHRLADFQKQEENLNFRVDLLKNLISKYQIRTNKKISQYLQDTLLIAAKITGFHRRKQSAIGDINSLASLAKFFATSGWTEYFTTIKKYIILDEQYVNNKKSEIKKEKKVLSKLLKQYNTAQKTNMGNQFRDLSALIFQHPMRYPLQIQEIYKDAVKSNFMCSAELKKIHQLLDIMIKIVNFIPNKETHKKIDSYLTDLNLILELKTLEAEIFHDYDETSPAKFHIHSKEIRDILTRSLPRNIFQNSRVIITQLREAQNTLYVSAQLTMNTHTPPPPALLNTLKISSQNLIKRALQKKTILKLELLKPPLPPKK